MEVFIRKMKKKDIPALQRVAKESWMATYEGIIPDEIQEIFLKREYDVHHLKWRLRHSFFLVALVNNELVGFINFTKGARRKHFHLYAIYLLPAYQGKQIGSLLIHRGIERLRAKKITLFVEEQNNQAIRFYERLGFSKVTRFQNELEGHVLYLIEMALYV
jgi:ribosomal protein S18 acetylase RimI-like enzyme